MSPDGAAGGGETAAAATSAGWRGFHRRALAERWHQLAAAGVAAADVSLLRQQDALLPLAQADAMVENVVGVFGLPLAVAPNLWVDGVATHVPLAVEEPSIVAALSSVAKLSAAHGGFVTAVAERLLVGQIQLTQVSDVAAASAALTAATVELLQAANARVPGLVRRGGGVRAMEVLPLTLGGAAAANGLAVHLHVDTCDAMGANAVNTLCEQLAPQLAALARAKVGLRILSNFTERSVVRAEVRLPCAALHFGSHAGEAVRDGIVAASDFAHASVHRAVTHNKGIMNAVDAVALATGNDWRAIEANVHAWAGRGHGYAPLSTWSVAPDGALVGRCELPLKVGTVGGNFAVNPGVGVALRLLGQPDAARLSRIMAAAGLAQNMAALRALSTDGIQRGHMALHARSVAASAGVPQALAAEVVAEMVRLGEVKVDKAQALAAALAERSSASASASAIPSPKLASSVAAADAAPQQLRDAARPAPQRAAGEGAAAAKVLLLGEHAVVYGARAVAVPLPLATRVVARPGQGPGPGVRLQVPAWNVDTALRWDDAASGLHRPLACLLRRLQLQQASLALHIDARVPRAMGLGSSAALAVATVRALSDLYALGLGDDEVSELAYAAETVVHGTASGVDNALSTRGRPLVFSRREHVTLTPLRLATPLHLVIGQTRDPSLTQTTVAQVRAAVQARPQPLRRIFDEVDRLVGMGLDALAAGDLAELGVAMNLNHGLLNALGVSTPALERAIDVARRHGALGAKLTGGGGGGSMVALCTAADAANVAAGLAQAGFAPLPCVVPATEPAKEAHRDPVP